MNKLSNFLHGLFENIFPHGIGNNKKLLKDSSLPQIINSFMQVVFLLDNNEQIIYLNKGWEKLTQFRLSESIGINFKKFLHPEDYEKFENVLYELINTSKKSYSTRIRIIAKDNHLCWMELHINRMPLDGENITGFSGILTDVSARVHEDVLYEAKYRTASTLINNLNGLVYRCRNDKDWTMEFVSAGAFELTGYKPSDLINKTVTFASLIHPDDRDGVWYDVQCALHENRNFELTYRLLTADGKEKWVWECGQGNFSSNGELLGIEGYITDITQKKIYAMRALKNSLYDTELNLPRRRLFMDRLDLAIARSNSIKTFNFSLLLVHIDRFKKLQARYNNETIEQITLYIKNILNEILNPYDSLCHIRDDEFLILLEHIDSINQVTTIAERINHILLSPLALHDKEIYITASIGVTLNTKYHIKRIDVIRETVAAMVRAKSLGGSCYQIYDKNIGVYGET